MIYLIVLMTFKGFQCGQSNQFSKTFGDFSAPVDTSLE